LHIFEASQKDLLIMYCYQRSNGCWSDRKTYSTELTGVPPSHHLYGCNNGFSKQVFNPLLS